MNRSARSDGAKIADGPPRRHGLSQYTARLLPATLLGAFLLLLALAAAGCGHQEVSVAAPEPPEVPVGAVAAREVTAYEDFTGQMDSVPSIVVRARVTGYLDRFFFKEGMEVKKGDQLFLIDPRPSAADLEKAKALVQQAQATYQTLKDKYDRSVVLAARGAIGTEDLEQIRGSMLEADAALKAAQANRTTAELNLEFTRVTSPIDGRISRKYVDPGNLVKADETQLTSIVALDPIYAYFDVDEATYLKLQRLVEKKGGGTDEGKGAEVALGLSDELGFPHKGSIDFTDIRIDSSTGTIRLRAKFHNVNRELSPGQFIRLFSPGLFVRLRLPIGLPHQAVLVPEQALGTDQGQKFVYVVNDKNRTAYRRVQLGLRFDELREITAGLKPGERIVTGDLQRVRPDIEVRPAAGSGRAGNGTAKGGKAKKPPAVAVVASRSYEGDVLDYEEFSGQTEAVSSIQVRARVNGYLHKAYFTEGVPVKKGDLLFEIDPRPYQAELERTKAMVRQAQATFQTANDKYERSVVLAGKEAIGAEELEKYKGDKLQAEAALGAAQANEKIAALNLEFTRVTSPIDGRVSRRFVDPGNLVKADDTVLTSIVSQDPIYAYFDIDERTVLKLRRLLLDRKIKSARETSVNVFLELADEHDFPHQGRMDFIDNKIDPTAGTLHVRGAFANPLLPGGGRLFSPGLFVRLRLPIGGQHKAVLVAERALWTDVGRKYLWVVEGKGGSRPDVIDGVVKKREVQVGMLHDGLREITQGLKPGEVVVVSGLQRVARPGIDVAARVVNMASFAQANPTPVVLGSQITAGQGRPPTRPNGPNASSGKAPASPR